jgi:ZIP family zinc transporter
LRFQFAPGTSLTLIALGSAMATGLGGVVALGLRRRTNPAGATAAYVAAGLVAYLAADRYGGAKAPSGFGPVALVGHSVFDGLGIGLAYQASSEVGLIVALGVITHDLCDGANTVNLSLASGNDPGRASRWLIADAVAPGAGILLSRLVVLDVRVTGSALAIFAGALLYLGAGRLAVEGYRTGRRLSNSMVLLLGGACIYGVQRLIRL